MSKKTPAVFKLSHNEESEGFESVFLHDEFASQEIFAEDLNAFFEFKSQLEMMNGSGFECSFNEVVLAAKDLQRSFKNCVNQFGSRGTKCDTN